MSFEWPTRQIQDVCSVGDGAHSKVQRTDTGVLYLTSKNIGQGTLKLDKHDFISLDSFNKLFPVQSKATRRPQPGDLLIGIIGTFGNAYLYRETDSFGFSSSIGIIRPNKEKILPRYLYYAVTSPKFKSTHIASDGGSAQGYTNIPAIKKLPVYVPPLRVQGEIASLLGALDDRINLLRETNTTLEAITQALFKSWFVEFDPVHAKADGRVPEGMDDATAALFPDRFEESALGLLPMGWKSLRLDGIAEVVMGLSPDGNSYNVDGVGTPLVNGPVEFGEYFPVRTKWTDAPTRFCKSGDLIFCVRGSTTGKRVVSDGDYCIGRGVAAIRSKYSANEFIQQSINLELPRLLEKTTGSVFPSLSAPDIKGFLIRVPDSRVLECFQRTAEPIAQRIRHNHRQIKTIISVRDILLPRLISGQLRLPDIAHQFEVVAA